MYWLYWLFILILLAAAGGAALLAYRTYILGDTSMPNLNVGGWLFRPRPEPRLGVIEQASVDARRRLVLIRRDGVEHLIMTGGPVDVVIETGIQAPPAERVGRAPAEATAPVFSRQPRSLGQAVNE
jgi:flagellar protein FliO/FliZ